MALKSFPSIGHLMFFENSLEYDLHGSVVILPKCNKTFTIYTKKDCNFCRLSKMLFKNYKIKYEEHVITDEVKDMIKTKFDHEVKTVPQIILEDKF